MALTPNLDLMTEECLVNGTVDDSSDVINSCNFPTSSRPRKETDHLEAIKIFDHASPVSATGNVLQTSELLMVAWALLLKSYTLSGPVSFVLLAGKDAHVKETKEGPVDDAGETSVCEYQISAGSSSKIVQLRKREPLTREITERTHINTAVHVSACKSSEAQSEELVRLPFLQQEGFKHQVRR
jgi:hypothetical protein